MQGHQQTSLYLWNETLRVRYSRKGKIHTPALMRFLCRTAIRRPPIIITSRPSTPTGASVPMPTLWIFPISRYLLRPILD